MTIAATRSTGWSDPSTSSSRAQGGSRPHGSRARLVDREPELAVLRERLSQGSAGTGSLTVITGPAATGKAALLQAVVEQAEVLGHDVLTASVSPIERGMPFQLIGKLLAHLPLSTTAVDPVPQVTDILGLLSADHAAADAAGHELTVLRGLADALVRPSRDRPLVLALTGVENADPLSLRLLLLLASQITSTSLTVIATVKTGATEPDASLQALMNHPVTLSLRLHPLMAPAVDELVRKELGDAAGALSAGCFEATGGNPLLAHAVIEDTRQARAVQDHPTWTLSVGASFRAGVCRLLHSCGPEVVKVAHALAILDKERQGDLLSLLAGLEPAVTSGALGILSGTGLVTGDRFRRHARDCVLNDMGHSARAAQRLQTAHLLSDRGASPYSVAPYLVPTGPIPCPWSSSVFQGAVAEALEADEPELAIDYLSAARAVTVDETGQAELLMRRVVVQWGVNPSAALRHLDQLCADLRLGHLPQEWALVLLPLLLWSGAHDRVRAILDDPAQCRVMPPAQALRVRQLLELSVRPQAAAPGPPRVPWVGSVHDADDVHGLPSLSTAQRASQVLVSVLTAGPSPEAVLMARQIVGHPENHPEHVESVELALYALTYCDEVEFAAHSCDRLLEEAQGRRYTFRRARFSRLRAEIALRQGDLSTAEVMGRAALDEIGTQGWGVMAKAALATVLRTATRRGELHEAAWVLALPAAETHQSGFASIGFLSARGHFYLRTDRLHAAVEAFESCGRLAEAWGCDQPTYLPWRGHLARTWLRLGDHEQARRLASDQVALLRSTRTQTYRDCARLLAEVLGTTARRSGQPARQVAPAPHQHRSGAPHRHTTYPARPGGLPGDARVPFPVPRVAAGRAPASGDREAAHPPAQEARRVDCPLSDAEWKVASLAAAGCTNRQISRRLFITVSTVEQHLTRAYRKLGVSSRNALTHVL